MATYSIETVKANLKEAEEWLAFLEKCNAILLNTKYSNKERMVLIESFGVLNFDGDLERFESWLERGTDETGQVSIRTKAVKNRIKRYKKRLAMC